MFDAKKCKEQLVKWTREYFEQNGPNSPAVIGISAGIDSSLTAAICVEALGKDRVFGVLLPDGDQSIFDALAIVNHLGIQYQVINIHNILQESYKALFDTGFELNTVVRYNTPARVRMMMLRAVSAIVSGRVSCNCNFDEDYLGYSTKDGDDRGDFALLKNLLKREIIAVARETTLPEKYIVRTPTDDLCGKSDEESFGFSYETFDTYIDSGSFPNPQVRDRIEALHFAGLHKVLPMPTFIWNTERKVY